MLLDAWSTCRYRFHRQYLSHEACIEYTSLYILLAIFITEGLYRVHFIIDFTDNIYHIRFVSSAPRYIYHWQYYSH